MVSPNDDQHTGILKGMSTRSSTSARWYILLLLPFAGLLYPPLYNRLTPALFGFPFFYWYQLLWVFLTTALLLFVYRKTKA